MKISVIIPVFKAEKYLNRCIESVIGQTYKDLEIILIDDGSPDSCGEICDYYSKIDNRIRVIHKKNEGVSVARNIGMNIMQGKYFFFLDSDDYIDKEAIKNLQNRAIKADADIVIGNYAIVDEHGNILNREAFPIESLNKELMQSSTEKFKYFFGKSYGRNVWNKLYKSKMIKELNIVFEKGINYGEDFLFNLELYVNFPKIELVNEYSYYYFTNNTSLTNTFKKDLTKQNIHILDVFYNYCNKMDKLDENKDLIAYSVFTMIDNSCNNCFDYSKNKIKDMKIEIKEFKNSIFINNAIKDIAKGKYLKRVPRKDWKYFAMIFSLLYTCNLISLSIVLQLLRFSCISHRRGKLKQ